MKYFIVPLIIGFFLGAASGLLFMCVAHRPMMHGRSAHPMREHFARELKLTPEQKQKVNVIFEDGHQKINAIFEQNRVPLEAVRASTRSQIRVLLDPQQQSEFDKMDAKMAARFKKRFEDGPDQWRQ
jgi:Spy/CpxP family protein refolding chaperone